LDLQVWAWLRFETFIWSDSLILHINGMRENQFVILQFSSMKTHESPLVMGSSFGYCAVH